MFAWLVNKIAVIVQGLASSFRRILNLFLEIFGKFPRDIPLIDLPELGHFHHVETKILLPIHRLFVCGFPIVGPKLKIVVIFQTFHTSIGSLE